MLSFLQDRTRRYQFQVLAATWLAYAATYLLRKPVSVAKSSIAEDLGFSSTSLGLLDTAFLLPYATAQIILSPLGDKLGARIMLSASLIGAAIAMFSVGWQTSPMIIIGLLFLNGVFQASSWPSCVKAIAPWVPEESRGFIFGLWGTCQSLGGVLGTLCAVHLMHTGGWRNTFFIPSVIALICGIGQIFFTVTPQDANLTPPNERAAARAVASASGQPKDEIPFSEAMKIPTLLNISIAFFSIKLIRYCLLMWLPMFFLKHLSYELAAAGIIATAFEVGGAIGTPVIGLVSDRVFKGKKIATTLWSQFLSGVFLTLFILSAPYSKLISGLCLVCVGVFSTGPDMMITGPIAAELGEYQGKNVQSTIAGIINGLGGLGAVVQGPLIGGVADAFGWGGVLAFIIFLSFFAVISLLPAMRFEQRKSLGLSTL